MSVNNEQITAAEAEIIPFGKHKGKKLGTIADTDILYLDWLVGQTINSTHLRVAVGVICEARSGEIAQAMEERER